MKTKIYCCFCKFLSTDFIFLDNSFATNVRFKNRTIQAWCYSISENALVRQPQRDKFLFPALNLNTNKIPVGLKLVLSSKMLKVKSNIFFAIFSSKST